MSNAALRGGFAVVTEEKRKAGDYSGLHVCGFPRVQISGAHNSCVHCDLLKQCAVINWRNPCHHSDSASLVGSSGVLGWVIDVTAFIRFCGMNTPHLPCVSISFCLQAQSFATFLRLCRRPTVA